MSLGAKRRVMNYKFIDKDMNPKIAEGYGYTDGDVKQAVKELKEYILALEPIDNKSKRIIGIKQYADIMKIFGKELT